MQSQRLAKSVSQALIGSPQAFPEVRESTDVLAAHRARPEDRRRRPGRRAGQRAGRARPADAAGRPRREERQHRDRAAEDPDPGGPGAAHHQPPVVRPAGDRRDGVVAEAAAGGLAGRAVGGRPAGDADAAHRQVGQRIPDHGRREPRGRVPARQGPELVPRNRRRAWSTATRNCACPAPRTRRPRSAWSRCSSSTKRPARRPAPFWATCRAWCPRARRRPRSLPTANRCAKAWRRVQERPVASRPASASCGLLALLAVRRC